MPLENISNASNITSTVQLTSPSGLLTLVIGLAFLVIAFYVAYKVLKNLVLNAIVGGIGLIIVHFGGPLLGLDVPINLLNILICIIAGLPGIVIVILISLLGL